eukprot:460313-Amphidinium_carterae.3
MTSLCVSVASVSSGLYAASLRTSNLNGPCIRGYSVLIGCFNHLRSNAACSKCFPCSFAATRNVVVTAASGRD